MAFTTGPGGLGFALDDDTLILWKLDDVSHPRDDAGTIDDLVPYVHEPTRIDGLLGYARNFPNDVASTGYLANELVAAGARNVRSMTGEFILRRSSWAAGVAELAMRVGAAPSYTGDWSFYLYGATAGLAWKTAASEDGGVVAIPDMGSEWFYLAIVRTWVSETSVLVDVYVNGKHCGQGTYSGGDIDGVVTQQAVYLGSHPASSGLIGDIDQVRISSVARSAEEIEDTYRATMVDPGSMLRSLRALMPRGERPYSTDPSSVVQALLAGEADLLATVSSQVRRWLDYWWPDRCWQNLARWERVLGVSPGAGDTIAERRARVASVAATRRTFTEADVLAALLESLDVASASDLEILHGAVADYMTCADDGETDPRHMFNGGSGTSLVLPDGMWTERDRDPTGFEVQDNGLQIPLAASTDLEWDANGCLCPILAWTINGQPDGLANGPNIGFGWAWDTGESSLPDGGYGGVFLCDRLEGGRYAVRLELFGTAGAWSLRIVTLVDGVETVVAGPSTVTSHYARIVWRRVHPFSGEVYDPARLAIELSSDGETWEGTNFAMIEWTHQIGWAGLFARHPATSTDEILIVRHVEVSDPMSTARFFWSVYRDQALGGSPILPIARTVATKLAHAHTLGLVTEVEHTECDDEHSLCDLTPL